MNDVGWDWARALMNETNWHWAAHCENDVISLNYEARDSLIEQKLLNIQCYELQIEWNEEIEAWTSSWEENSCNRIHDQV